MPEIEDEVLVGFEYGDFGRPLLAVSGPSFHPISSELDDRFR